MLQKVKMELLPRINTFLDCWRGQVPDRCTFVEATDRVVCVQCRVRAPNAFSRSASLTEFNEWILESSIGSLTEQAASKPPQMTCSYGHTVCLDESLSLSRSVKLEAVPCPKCPERGSLPPFALSLERCRLYLTEAATDGSRVDFVQCPRCNMSIYILHLVALEVVLSYDWDVRDTAMGTWSTLSVVEAMRCAIEDGADIVTWSSIDGSTSDELFEGGETREVEQQMEQCIAQSAVIVIFPSDAYLNSSKCQRELRHAVLHRKYIIPALLPNKGLVGSNGLTSISTAWDIPISFSLSSLKLHRSTGVNWLSADHGTGAPEPASQFEHLAACFHHCLSPAPGPVQPEVKRIQSRIHRCEHIAH